MFPGAEAVLGGSGLNHDWLPEPMRDVTGMPKIPPAARVDSRNRRVVVPEDANNPWNGELVLQPTFAALVNLTSGKKAAAGE